MKQEGPYDALLLLSFGGPERPDEVMPFLENVVRGKRVPRERLEHVAKQYMAFGGRSPLNDENRHLRQAVEEELAQSLTPLRVYWGNRNWHPMLRDTLVRMRDDGVKHALAFVTSAFASYSGCRQYLDDIEAARAEVGDDAPEITKLRLFFDHPGFLEPIIDNVRVALDKIGPDSTLLFTAHSIPATMAKTSKYAAQLNWVATHVARRVLAVRSRLVFQSRSGLPTTPWLEPDVCDAIREEHARGVRDVAIAPIGFVSEHLEVIWDLDTAALGLARELEMRAVRSTTPSRDPRFIAMVRELVLERTIGEPPLSLAPHELSRNQCAPGCCAYSPGA